MESFKHLAGLGSLKSWLASNLPWIKSGGTLAPRAVVLAGLPGTGKNTTARAIASALGMPLARYGEIPTENLPSLPALLVEDIISYIFLWHLSQTAPISSGAGPKRFALRAVAGPPHI